MNARYLVRNRLKSAGLSILLFGGVLLQAGCVDAFLGEDIENTPGNNFDVLWQDIDRYYALFALKEVSWDSLYAALRPRIAPPVSEDSLFAVLCDMIHPLNDIHVLVQTGERTCISDQTKFVNDLNLRSVERFLTDEFSVRAGGRLQYGRIVSERRRLGYLHISSFSGDGTPVATWVAEVDAVLEELADTDGLILDVRSNNGGNGFNAADLAGRFTDTSRPYLVTQTRNGSGHADFTSPHTWSIEPRGSNRYLKPIAVLTNRLTFSAAEWFVLGMRTIPQATVIGTRTGGGLSSRLYRTLPNGWAFSISIQRVGSSGGEFYEGIGISPDIPVDPTARPLNPDPVLRTAVEYLK